MKLLPLLFVALLAYVLTRKPISTEVVQVYLYHDGSRAYLVRCDGGGKA